MPIKDDPSRLIAETYPIQFTYRVIYNDMDAFRHVNNVAVGRYFEEGRSEINMLIFGVQALIDPPADRQLLSASISIDYLLQAYYPGMITLSTGIKRIGRTSFMLAQAAFQDGKCFALCDGVIVKATNGRPAEFSVDEREVQESLLLKPL